MKARIPAVRLEEPRSSWYVDWACSTLGRARLSRQYPDARLLSAHIECLGREFHLGLYDGLDVDLRSGLPTYKEWARVQSDHQIAPEALARLPDVDVLVERSRGREGSIHGKQLLKRHYYQSLLGKKLQSLSHMEVALRRVEPEHRTAYFHIIFDKLDATGILVRYSIDLSQRSAAFDRAIVTLDDDEAGHTEALRSMIFRFTSLDAEMTFAKLAVIEGVDVERVVKGVVGPFFFSDMDVPDPLQQALVEYPDGFVGTFALDMAALDVASDRDNDPLSTALAERLSPEAREEYQRARSRFGYKVFKDRKFVASSELRPCVDALCRGAGTRNLILIAAASARPR